MPIRQVAKVPDRKGPQARAAWYAKDLRDFVRQGMDAAILEPPEGRKAPSLSGVNKWAREHGLPVHAVQRGGTVYLERVVERG